MAGRKDENGLTPKRVAFCRAYIETGNASEAYRRSFSTENMKPETAKRNAHELMKDSNVLATIEKLRAESAERHEITVDSLTQMLKEDREGAREAGQFAAAISAVKATAQLHGLLVEKKDISLRSTVGSMNDDELDRFIAELDEPDDRKAEESADDGEEEA
jgi:phage terminase small subunit